MPRKRLIRSTTVLCVRRNGNVVMAGDGQVTLGEGIIKHSARKIRRLYNDKILAGFAGSTADAFSLFGRFEAKLEQYHGNLGRGAVELAKEWRTDKMLRHLEALLLVADGSLTFLISGAGDVIEPDGGVAAIGSGGSYALASARALMDNTDLPARKIAEEAMKIAGKICIYTNEIFTIEELSDAEKKSAARYSGNRVSRQSGHVKSNHSRFSRIIERRSFFPGRRRSSNQKWLFIYPESRKRAI